VPIVAIGAEDDEAIAVEAVHAGAQDYLVKGRLNASWLVRSMHYAIERQNADLALHEAEEKYRNLFSHLVEGIFRTTSDGRYLMANQALARIYGYDSPEELIKRVTDIGRRLYVQPGRRAEFKRIMEEKDTITAFESQIYRKDGSTIWISENCHAIRDPQGKLLHYEGTVEDITQRREVEEDLRHSEALYHSLVETLPQNIFRKDVHGCFTFANQQFCKTLGLPLEEIVGKTDYDFFPTEMAAKFQKDDHQVLEHGKTLETVEENQPPGKPKSYVQVVKTPLRGGYGQIIGLQGIFWDITAQKLAEEKVRQAQENLRASEALYHSLVETMPQAVFRRDLEGRFTFVNQPYCKYHEVKSEDLLGKTDFDLYPQAAAEKYWVDDLRVIQGGETMDIVEVSRPIGATQTRYLHVIKSPLRDAVGSIIGLQGMFWDITEQKRAEEKLREAQESLRESETLYHSLVDTMPQSIFRKDIAGRYTFANREFCRAINRPLEEVLGKSIFDFLPPDIAKLRQEDDQRVTETGRPITHVEQNKFQNRDDQYIQVLKIPIFDAGGQVVGVQGMFWDISEQKLAEERIRRANDELAASQEKLRVRNMQMEEDLKMAGEIQAAMLPNLLPTFPRGVPPAESAFQFTHRYRPTGAVGGDFFNVTALSDTEAAVFICDVAGHDVRSALVTAMIRAFLEELRPLAGDPGLFLTKLNRDLGAILKHAGTPVLTTAFYLVADSATGKMHYANAGHPKPLHVRRKEGTVQALINASKKSQAALGLFDKVTYETSEAAFAPHDLVMLYTDGLYEVHNPGGDLYTQAMLTAGAHQHANLPAEKLFDQLLQEIRQFAGTQLFDDDVCLVGVERPDR
jgi:sigma-B regulation protein RsbU (phosphoserine phosphatase)